MKRHCLTLDLKDDPELIADYEEYHKSVWPEILQSIREAGIEQMEIYRINDDFSFEKKQQKDEANKKVQEWEELMWKYQQALPGSKSGEKWRLMDKIFTLNP